jgi:hypothetical protein
MSQKSGLLESIKIPYPTEGIIRSAQLNDTVTPENSVQLAVNMNFDRIGSIQTRPGVENYATTRGGSVLSFGALNIQNGIQRLFAQVGTDVSLWDGSNWTTRRTLTSATNKARYSQFLNYLWMCNGNGNGAGGDAVMTSAGGVFGTTMVPTGFPKVDFISAGFEGRVWGADKSTDTIYYTDIVQFAPPSTYTLTFNINVNFIQNLSPQDGQSITALKRVPRALLVFKEDQIFRIYGATSVDAYPAYNVGTYSQESIVTTKDGIYFHHSSGFYKFDYGSQPVEISRRVIDFVKAIPKASYANIVGIYDGYDAVKWSVGAVTVEGVTYSNCQMRYSISTQVWTIYDFAGNNITALIRYDNGTTIEQVVGTSAGLVGKLDSGTTDFGSPINFEMIDRWRSYTAMYSKSKSISGLMVMSENGAGTELMYQTEKSQPNVWEAFETLKENYDCLIPNARTEDFNNSRLRLKGISTGTPMIFHGIEILSINDKGYDQN